MNWTPPINIILKTLSVMVTILLIIVMKYSRKRLRKLMKALQIFIEEYQFTTSIWTSWLSWPLRSLHTVLLRSFRLEVLRRLMVRKFKHKESKSVLMSRFWINIIVVHTNSRFWSSTHHVTVSQNILLILSNLLRIKPKLITLYLIQWQPYTMINSLLYLIINI